MYFVNEITQKTHNMQKESFNSKSVDKWRNLNLTICRKCN